MSEHASGTTAGRLIVSAPQSGEQNMSIDQAILQACGPQDAPTLRFYRWRPATLSLGYFQSIGDRQRHTASRDCPAVRRSSGGGAILHDRELTYSLVLPVGFLTRRCSSSEVYRLVHQVVIDCLRDCGITAQRHGDIAAATDRRGDTGGDGSGKVAEPFLCFQRRSAEDLTVHGYKILGSAQRKTRHAVLQHGSLLLAASPAAPELPGLLELTSTAIDDQRLAAAIATELGGRLAVHWSAGNLNNNELDSLKGIASEKYASLHWLNKR